MVVSTLSQEAESGAAWDVKIHCNETAQERTLALTPRVASYSPWLIYSCYGPGSSGAH